MFAPSESLIMQRLSICLLAIVILCSSARPARADFTFIHASDIHVGAGDNAANDVKCFTEISKLDPRPAFVFVTGDICETGTVPQYEEYRKTIKSLGEVKIYCAPGNHDIRWNPIGK